MTPAEYNTIVAEVARQHVSENKPIHKAIAKIVIKHTPMAILANSLREPTEDELLDVVEQHNPFAVEDLSDDLRARYTAICKLHLDVKSAVSQYRSERLVPASYRILESKSGRYLTWVEANPDCEAHDDDKMAEFTHKFAAHDAAENYSRVMESVGANVAVEVAAFNRYHERIQ